MPTEERTYNCMKHRKVNAWATPLQRPPGARPREGEVLAHGMCRQSSDSWDAQGPPRTDFRFEFPGVCLPVGQPPAQALLAVALGPPSPPPTRPSAQTTVPSQSELLLLPSPESRYLSETLTLILILPLLNETGHVLYYLNGSFFC